MITETRSVIDRSDAVFEHGHRETRSHPDGQWTVVPRSGWTKAIGPFWFQKTPKRIMAEDMGFETAESRANEFEAASGNDPAMWQYLATASRDHGFMGEPSDEPLKWIMSALAAEVKVRGLRFIDIPRILPAHYLSWFAYAIREGAIDRSFSKAVMAELLTIEHLPLHDPRAGLGFNTLIAKPEYQPLGASQLDVIMNQIVSANPDQFAKAKENPKLIQWFVGQAMKATGGKASASDVNAIMTKRLAA
jgi:Asp-tRNA(Asn)/Glu-tRNA(Gln) amidotransferase B subunit